MAEPSPKLSDSIQAPESDSPSPEPDDADTYVLGDTITLGNWEITVTDFSFKAELESDYSTITYPAGEGNQYGVAYVTVTNTGTEADNFLPTYSFSSKDVRAKIYYQDEYEYSGTIILGYSKDLHDSHMNPLTEKTGILAFSVPDSVADDDGKLVLTFS